MKIDKTKFLWGLLILVFIIRVLYFLAQPDMCTDHVTQMALAENFMNGNGISLAYVSEDDISKTNYKPQILWPPLYIIILGILSSLTHNALFSSFIIRVIVVLTIALFLFKLISNYKDFLSLTNKLFLIAFIIISTSIFNNINTILYIPLVIFFICIYYFLQYINSNSKNYIRLVLISLFLSVCFWFHYLYMITVYFITFYFLYNFLVLKKKEYIINSFTSLLAISISLGALLLYNYFYAGTVSYFENAINIDKGLFLNNLININPFFLYVFLKTEYLFLIFKSNIFLKLVLNSISFILLIFIIMNYKNILNLIDSYNKNRIKILMNTFTIIFLLGLILPIYFSLRYNYLSNPDWTYVSESRYFTAIHLIITIVLFFFSFNVYLKGKRTMKFLRIMFVLSIVISMFINLSIVKRGLSHKFFNIEKLIRAESISDLYFNIKKEKENNRKVVYIDNGATVRQLRMAAFAGASICDSAYFLNKEIKTSDTVACIFSVLTNSPREIDFKLKDFGVKNNYVKIGVIYGEPLYKVYLKP